MKLYVGTDSTWSLRALICFDIAQVIFDLEIFKLNDDASRKSLKEISPTGLVPFLRDEDLLISDSLSIAEYLNEYKKDSLYPIDPAKRALSRSLCTEIHSGFMSVRQQMPFSTSPNAKNISLSPLIQNELMRIESIFSDAKADFFWGEKPTAVDAFYSVMAFRLKLYGIDFSGNAGRYQNSMVKWDSLTNHLKTVS
ncbi:glutathione S-transferase family protein [Pantoea sp. Ae16]|uniref:glutathione S-transferase family protein n=1 Tax=Pantoea sp. Ae16 TaxID=1890373 RepID=UPI0008FD7D60|nr:glutathione S-transferase N-terminal domain-containing protein [Pantoea sp. Ae16]OIX90478.1 hypothetical protein BFS13_09780 [Pantoea sp. Ae16]